MDDETLEHALSFIPPAHGIVSFMCTSSIICNVLVVSGDERLPARHVYTTASVAHTSGRGHAARLALAVCMERLQMGVLAACRPEMRQSDSDVQLLQL
jgi:hypothetical protein